MSCYRALSPSSKLKTRRYTEDMHYELWGVESANLLAEFETEEEGLAFVRSLLGEGWSGDELSLGPPPDVNDPQASASRVLTGAALAERARATLPRPGAISA